MGSPAWWVPGGRMRPCHTVPVLLLLLGLARATTPGLGGHTTLGSDGPTTTPPVLDGSVPPGLWTVSYGDVVTAAVELLNTRAVSPYVLQLREAQPQPDQPVDLQRRQQLSFTVEETSCRVPAMATTACKSHWLRAVMRCQGWVFLEQQQPTVELSCETVPTMRLQLRTSRLKDLFTHIKERFRNFFRRTKIWIRDKLNLKPAGV